MDVEADDLAEKISSLSVKETKVLSTVGNSNSVIRTVKIPASEEDEDYSYDHNGVRQFLENDAINANTSRPSFGSHSHSCELTLHLYGHSPRFSMDGRPPKVSLSALPFEGVNNNAGIRSSRTPCTNNPCFVTTYVYNDASFFALMFDLLSFSFCVLICLSPLMSQDRGWGCRPVSGKDWGSSVTCNVAVQHELMARLELALKAEGMYPSFAFWQLYFRN
jgi:hypothetical protein